MALFNLNDLHLFVQAVDSGGFTAAARHLGIPKSTVSKRVAELEGRLGVRLIQRTSRSFALTELGREFFQHAQASIIEAEMAEGIVRRHLAEPAGSVRLTASVPTAQFTLTEHLPALAARYPKLRLSVHVTDRFVDIVQEGFDIALRSHRAPLPDSALVQRKLASHPFFILASPDYIRAHGEPSRPEELAQHATIMTSLTDNQWRLYCDSGEKALVTLQSVMAADEPYVLMEAAAAGLGITCLPTSVCRKALATMRLVRLLPDWTAGSIETTILMPHRRGQLPAVRAVVDFLAERLAG
ncbi:MULTISPECIES: LysR substrate-binding domain-containing protein [unclassified Rhizobium]|uniref:LysR substrate-binding domain-containing protein n=1 Tax=unclassified Rhizobium TaxID=2613769 RepID=UPI001A994AE7|nr:MULTISPECIES: LysR substrate-binding domain-containing protein [unclassified Rhizobium]MBX5165815.1 LysR family transcriptional regulator [Rhizobium sp. NZLR4b]MBX5172171.1 LysR family transcriptional regulator [Rhizobium sp. NZLR1b]MBX5191743.1 LysR family transcriptional regulator [Rhizobium sp. NZLR3b]MBX5196955.1 LysR family transcriptional regulator [Rhizobium sp. NZLR10]MBX5205181.1 LysR family transcriptional regulator [Rhizobium sp. NZLR1]